MMSVPRFLLHPAYQAGSAAFLIVALGWIVVEAALAAGSAALLVLVLIVGGWCLGIQTAHLIEWHVKRRKSREVEA